MRILILGAAGYIGTALTNHLSEHDLVLVDNLSRRYRARHSLTGEPGANKDLHVMSVENVDLAYFGAFDAIFHLAEMPSAPWSMQGAREACLTQQQNTVETLNLLWSIKEHSPDAHLIKIGSMGEYGTPDCDIPEGYIPPFCLDDFRLSCPMGGMQFPKQPGSFYHLSKVFDSMNIEFACRIWGLKATDINQGIVFGLNYWDQHLTRFDYDEYFGTVINRFAAQALCGHPLTVYGEGGQTRGYLPLSDSLECLTLALNNPSDGFRVFNQYAKIFSVIQLAEIVKECAMGLGYKVEIEHIPNPRVEAENHSYTTSNDNLRHLGYNPKWDIREEVTNLLTALEPYKSRIKKEIIRPKTNWR